MTSTFVLIHGAGGSAWSWHLVEPMLTAAGHRVVAPSLPCDDDSVGLEATVDLVLGELDGAGPHGDLIVVGHSLGGLVAPLVARARDADRLVLVAPMIPEPGERGLDWWDATGHAVAVAAAAKRDGRDPDGEFDPLVLFLHDVPPDLAAEAGRQIREQTAAVMADPCPLETWPDIDTTVVAGRYDRFFPLEFIERTAADRLGVGSADIEVVDTGHLPVLAAPDSLAAKLLAHAT